VFAFPWFPGKICVGIVAGLLAGAGRDESPVLPAQGLPPIRLTNWSLVTQDGHADVWSIRRLTTVSSSELSDRSSCES